jgi:hypothetical protein
MRWLAILLVVGACSKSSTEERPAEPPPLIPADEIKRAADACAGYVTRVCACAETVAAAKEDCALAKSLPDAIDVARRLAANPKADQEDAVQAAGSVRKTVKVCIEKTAKLAELGCP